LRNKSVLIFSFLLLTYLVLSLALPSDPAVIQKYHTSQTAVKLIGLTVLIPLTLIYASAMYGYVRVQSFARTIKDTKEGPHYQDIATGLMVMAFSLPITSIVGSVVSYARHQQPANVGELTVLRNYLTLVLAIISILYIARGTQGLYRLLNKKYVSSDTYPYLGILGTVALASGFTWLITSQGDSASSITAYGMPEWLIVLTLAIPYSYIWCTGAKAATELWRYSKGIKGILYKRAIGRLAQGVLFLIIISILIQFFTTLSGPLNRLNLTPILVILYVLIIIYAVGFGLVASGAKKLKQIEEA
jgi:hypothetical protein